jgi:hypothetical protein
VVEMASQETTAETSAKSEDQKDGEKIVLLPPGIVEIRLSKEARIKGVTRSLVVDALAVLDDMWEECQQSPNLKENCYLLYKYLGYLKRFCEGKA